MSKGYFFTLDAFIAMGILMVGLAIVLGSYSYKPVVVQSNVLSADILLALSNTRVSEMNNDYVRLLLQNGSITNPDNSLLAQAAEFSMTGKGSMATTFVNETTKNLLPNQFSANLSINKTTLFFKGTSASSSRVLVSSKSIVFGIMNNTLWGPIPVEVNIWE